jgi:hypothetical protein
MLFKKGDVFEKHGKGHYHVIFANDDFFICCPVHLMQGEVPQFWVNHPETYSNKGSLEDKYWIKKIDAYAGIYSEGKEL